MSNPVGSYDFDGTLRDRPFVPRRLGHVGIYVEDREECDHFFSHLLGFAKRDDLPVGSLYSHSTDHHTLALIDGEVGRMRGFADRGVTLNQMSFQVSTLEEVVSAEGFLKQRGTVINRSGRDIPGSNWALYVHDPDDHVIELFYGMEQVGWNGHSKPFSVPRATNGSIPPLPVLAEWDELREALDKGVDLLSGHQQEDPLEERFDVGGVLLPRPFKVTGIGPVYLFVQDVEISVDWYVNGFGLSLTEEIDFKGSRVAFLRSGTAHHEVVLLDARLRDHLRSDPTSTTLCIAVKVANYRQLRMARDYCRSRGFSAAGLPQGLFVGMGPGFDLVAPGGQIIRMFYEMEQIGSVSSSQWTPPDDDSDPWPENIEATGVVDGASDFLGPLG